MEIQPTTELKARFFAQYWGQPLIGTSNGDKQYAPIEGYPLDNHKLLENCFLELKSLSSITDEDAIEVAKMDLGRDYEGKMNEYLIKHAKINVLDNLKYLYCDVSDYLRSKGYALPFMGIQVETFIEWGWVKLQTD